MNFEELLEKYMKNSSCNIHQICFIWNAAIDEAIKEIKSSQVNEPVKILEQLKVKV
jgi:hypothetical protein